MQISSRFTVAVHIISLLKMYGNPMLCSEQMAQSINTNPVVVRRILGMLKRAGIVNMSRGTGGAYLVKPVEEITMLDIYQAVCDIERGKLFRMHAQPNTNCPVGANIQQAINGTLLCAQNAMEQVLEKTSMAEIVSTLCQKTGASEKTQISRIE